MQIHMIRFLFESLMCSNLAILLDTHCFTIRFPIQCQLRGECPISDTNDTMAQMPLSDRLCLHLLMHEVRFDSEFDDRKGKMRAVNVSLEGGPAGLGLGWAWVVHSVVQNLLRKWDIA